MVPSPATPGKTSGPPKTPTKLSRRPQGQTPQSQSNTARKSTPSTLKTSDQPKSSPIQPKDETLSSDVDDDHAGKATKGIQMKGEDKSDAEHDDEEPLSKVSPAGGQSEELQSADPQPIRDDDDDDVNDNESAQGQHDQPMQQAESQAKGLSSDDQENDNEDATDGATGKVRGTAESTGDVTEDQKQSRDQGQPKGKKGRGLLSGARSLAGKAGSLAARPSSAGDKPTTDDKNMKFEDGKAAVDDPATKSQDAAKNEDADKIGKVTAKQTDNASQQSTEQDLDEAKKVAGEGTDEAEETVDGADSATEDENDDDEDKVDGQIHEAVSDDEGEVNGEVAEAGQTQEQAQNGVEESTDDVKAQAEDEADEDEADEDADSTVKAGSQAEEAGEDAAQEEEPQASEGEAQEEEQDPEDLPIDLSVLNGLEVNEDGNVYDREGHIIGTIVEGDAEDLEGYPINDVGEILDDDGDLVGRVELTPDIIKQQLRAIQEEGGELSEAALKYLGETGEDEEDAGEEEGEDEDEEENNLPSVSILKGLKPGADGLIYDDEGNTVGRLAEGELNDLQDAVLNEQGEFVDDDGNVIGRAEIHEDAEALVEQGVYEPARKDNEQAEKAQERQDSAQDEEEKPTEAEQKGKDVSQDSQAETPEIEDQLPGIEALKGMSLDEIGEIHDEDGNILGGVKDEELKQKIADGEIDPATLKIDDQGQILDEEDNVVGSVEVARDAAQMSKLHDLRILNGKKINSKGVILDDEGEKIGELSNGDLTECKGKKANEKGEVVDKNGKVIGNVRVVPGDAAENATRELLEELGELQEDEHVEQEEDQVDGEFGKAEDAQTKSELGDEDAADVEEEQMQVDDDEEVEEQPEEEADQENPAVSMLEGLKVNKKGQVLNEDGEPIGELTAGELKKCAGKKINDKGEVLDSDGKTVIGHVRTLPEEAQDPGVSVLEGLKVNKKGQVLNEDGDPIGELTAGEISQCAGKKINEKGEILDADGNVLGSVRTLPPPDEEVPEESEEVEEEVEESDDGRPPVSILEGRKINKGGNIINENNVVIGQLVEGNAKKIYNAGLSADDQGQFWDSRGHVIGRAETVAVEDPEQEPEFAGLEGLRVVEDGFVQDANGNTVGYVTEGDHKKLIGRSVDEDGDIIDKQGSTVGKAKRYEEEEQPEETPDDLSFLKGKTVTSGGYVMDDDDELPLARVIEGYPKKLAGKQLDDQGQVWSNGKVIGRVELIPEDEREEKGDGPFAGLKGLSVIEGGLVADENGNVVGEVTEGDKKRLIGLAVEESGEILNKYGVKKGFAEPLPDDQAVDYSVLDGLTLNSKGYAVNSDGVPIGKLIEGNSAELEGRTCDEQGIIHDDRGKQIGRCEPLPESERFSRPEGQFAGLEGLRVVKGGMVEDEDGNVVGEVTSDNPKRLIGLAVDEEGRILDKFGNKKGEAVRTEEEDEQPVDNSALEGKKLNKSGFVMDGDVRIGRLVEGNLTELVGRMCDENGVIHGDTGKPVGQCMILPENERVSRSEGVFDGLEGLRVVKGGKVEDVYGNQVGIITEGDPKRLVGMHVDEEGEIVDKYGNVKGKAEPWSEEDPEAADLSSLKGTKINSKGYAVDGSGTVLGRVVDGDPSIMEGKKVDGQGQVWDDAGNVIGQCELVSGVAQEEGPFAGFEGLQINKDETITTPAGDIVGRVVEGDIKKLLGHQVSENGDINDKNGNRIGRAERWEPDEKERRANPMAGMRVNKEGEVRDENGDLMGRLTMGDLGHCVGQEIDNAGNVVDVDGNKIGEVTLLENIDEETYEGPTEEELEEAAKRDEEREIAEKMGTICQQTLERMQPICKQISEHMEKADRTPREELDEEDLVNKVKPLIEEGGRILQECNGSLRGLDPDGKIAAQAKGRAGTGEATPEEYRLAETLKELTTTVVKTIDDAKKKLNDMPHAKKKLSPLWALLTQPLFQILAAVGLLLAGVLGLVGQLLNALGLGGLVNGLLGGLGINKLLQSFGLPNLGGSKKGSGKNPLSSVPLVGGLIGKKD
jgi:hypothetical protein